MQVCEPRLSRLVKHESTSSVQPVQVPRLDPAPEEQVRSRIHAGHQDAAARRRLGEEPGQPEDVHQGRLSDGQAPGRFPGQAHVRHSPGRRNFACQRVRGHG